jgi:hypothetical protein
MSDLSYTWLWLTSSSALMETAGFSETSVLHRTTRPHTCCTAAFVFNMYSQLNGSGKCKLVEMSPASVFIPQLLNFYQHAASIYSQFKR